MKKVFHHSIFPLFFISVLAKQQLLFPSILLAIVEDEKFLTKDVFIDPQPITKDFPENYILFSSFLHFF